MLLAVKRVAGCRGGTETTGIMVKGVEAEVAAGGTQGDVGV